MTDGARGCPVVFYCHSGASSFALQLAQENHSPIAPESLHLRRFRASGKSVSPRALCECSVPRHAWKFWSARRRDNETWRTPKTRCRNAEIEKASRTLRPRSAGPNVPQSAVRSTVFLAGEVHGRRHCVCDRGGEEPRELCGHVGEFPSRDVTGIDCGDGCAFVHEVGVGIRV
jgi:hypothetical protein